MGRAAELAEPWERQGESTAAWTAFVVYRDMGGDRSLTKVARLLGKNRELMGRWSGQHRWVQRCWAWDQHVDQEARDTELAEIREMRARHAKQSQLLQQKLVERLRSLKPEELSARDVAHWLEVAVKIERLSRGEATEQVQVSTDAAAVQLARILDETIPDAAQRHRLALQVLRGDLGAVDGEGGAAAG